MQAAREPIHVTLLASADETPRPEIRPRRPVLPAPPMALHQPALISTAQTHIASLAAPVVPVPYVASSSTPQPFSALGTAFAKTGAALTLAFKKTGQGILAPF